MMFESRMTRHFRIRAGSLLAGGIALAWLQA